MSLLWRKGIPTCPSSFRKVWWLERIRSLSPMRPSTKPGYGFQEHPVDLTSAAGVWLMGTEVTACRFINCEFIERAHDKSGRPFACWLSAVLYDRATSNFAMRFRFWILEINPAHFRETLCLQSDHRASCKNSSSWWAGPRKVRARSSKCDHPYVVWVVLCRTT